MKMISFGEIVWDIYGTKKTLGGAPLNLAAYAAMLGGEAYLVSAVGQDALGEEAVAQIIETGVDTSAVTVVSGKETGQCLVVLDEQGHPTYRIVDDTAYDYIKTPSLKMDNGILAFGSMALRHENNRNVLQEIIDGNRFSEIFTDLNIRAPFYSAESVLFCLRHATLVKISEEELPEVLRFLMPDGVSQEDALRRIAASFGQIKAIILTKGEHGSCCYDCRGDRFYACPAEKTEVVSTVGAGDSFGAAFLTQYSAGAGYQECIEFASKVSALICSKKETISPEIHRALQDLIAAQRGV